jgi:hypothetical protein
MNEITTYIDSDYLGKASATETLVQPKSISESIKVEDEKYGAAKPRRVILKAKVIHDQS